MGERAYFTEYQRAEEERLLAQGKVLDPLTRRCGWANVAEAALPLMERFGVATDGEVGTDTLTERLLAEVHAEHGVGVGPCLYGAWATV